MSNNKADHEPAQSNGRKHPPTTKLKLNGSSVELPADEDAVRQLMLDGFPEPDLDDVWKWPADDQSIPEWAAADPVDELAGLETRRFAVMDVSHHRIGDKAYFNALWTQMKEGGTAAMLHDLLSMDLQGWHPRDDVPQTDALLEQKLESLKRIDMLVYLLANEVRLPCLATPSRPNVVVTTGENVGMGFIIHAKRLVPSLRYVSGAKIKEALAEEYQCEADTSNGKGILIFPRLEDLRKSFEKQIGHHEVAEPRDD